MLKKDKASIYTGTEYYDQRGLGRFTMVLPKTHKSKVLELSKKHKLAQGEVIQVLIERMHDIPNLADFFQKKCESRVDGRYKSSQKKVLLESLMSLPEDQLALIVAQISNSKGSE
jgi:hypothetical protein